MKKNNTLELFPVIFFVFKRPDSIELFLHLMKKAGIRTIYIYADGPKNKIEKFQTDLVKANIEKFYKLNPNIRVIAHYSVSNIGLKRNIIEGLSQVFETEEAALILEDDCLPTLDFFRFTTEMLTRYRDDNSIMSINGTSVGGVHKESYSFTKYPQCWGWATWKRAWKLYDSKLSEFTDSNWKAISPILWRSRVSRNYWYYMLKIVKSGWISTWDFQWSFAHFIHHGLAIVPSSNLIKNIGFDSAATNTKTKTRVAGMSSHGLDWPLRHPSDIVENLSVSAQIEKHFYNNPVAVLGLVRQYIYWTWSKYDHRD